jgi:hypothetical protein
MRGSTGFFLFAGIFFSLLVAVALGDDRLRHFQQRNCVIDVELRTVAHAHDKGFKTFTDKAGVEHEMDKIVKVRDFDTGKFYLIRGSCLVRMPGDWKPGRR